MYKFLFIYIFFSSIILSHGGGLDKYGCHKDNKNAGYHCHKGSSLISKTTKEDASIKVSENYINTSWCRRNKGISEYRTKDGTYVDCLTEDYAIETEFDNNWKEAIGQSLHYAESTNKKAAILLIIQDKSQKDYYDLLMRVINNYNLPIKVFLEKE